MTGLTHSSHPFFSEKAILFPVVLLSGIGLVMVYSASSAIGMQEHGTLFHYTQKQAIFMGLGFCVLLVTATLPYRLYRHLSYLILILSVGLLIAVLIPQFSVTANKATRWLNLGGLTFQPAEFAKLAMILFMAYSLAKKQAMIKDFSVGFLPHAVVLALLACLIILQPDFGTIVVMGIICWGMMFSAGVKIRHLLLPVPLLVSVGYFLVVKEPYRLKRVLIFMDPWSDPFGDGYQITHSLKAFGSGGIFGKGIGLGMQKMHYLPEPHTDFIFSIIGEELGLAGVMAVLSLYMILIMRGMKIARTCHGKFGQVAALGLTLYIATQVIINTGVALGLMPTKGLTLPFISYGGTSLLVNMAAMGILMNIGASGHHEQAV